MNKVTFLVTNKCNFKCKHCFVVAGSCMKGEMSHEEKFKAIDNLKKLGVNKITFSGGEPLVEKDIFEYVKHTKNNNLNVGFLTNGLLLDDEKIKFLATNVDSLSISLYTNDILELPKQAYDFYFEKTIRNLKRLTELKYKFKVTIPISSKNQNNLDELIQRLYDEKIKPKAVRVYMITPVGRGKENKNICTENLNCVNLINKLPDYLKISDLNISAEYSSIPSEEKNDARFFTHCPMLEYSSSNYINKFADPHMDSNGDLYLCGLVLKNKEFCVGNILRNSTEQIIENIQKLIDKLRNEERTDCCPALNREKVNGRCLVCPVVYLNKGEK